MYSRKKIFFRVMRVAILFGLGVLAVFLMSRLYASKNTSKEQARQGRKCSVCPFEAQCAKPTEKSGESSRERR